jgi:hypothetical protein
MRLKVLKAQTIFRNLILCSYITTERAKTASTFAMLNLLTFCSLAFFPNVTWGSTYNNMNDNELAHQDCSISETSAREPALFGIFTLATDTESMDVMRQQYSSNDQNHYVMMHFPNIER